MCKKNKDMNKKKKLYKIAYSIIEESNFSLRNTYDFNMIIPAKDEVAAIQIFNDRVGSKYMYKIISFNEYNVGDEV